MLQDLRHDRGPGQPQTDHDPTIASTLASAQTEPAADTVLPHKQPSTEGTSQPQTGTSIQSPDHDHSSIVQPIPTQQPEASDVSHATNNHESQQQPHLSAPEPSGQSMRNVENDSSNQHISEPDIDATAISASAPDGAEETSPDEMEMFPHSSTDVMELTPEVSSLLPISDIARTATPLLEAEPVLLAQEPFIPVQDADLAVTALEGLSTSAIPVPTHATEHDAPPTDPPTNDAVLPDTAEPAFLDDAFSDTDSALGGMSQISSLTSITDSIYEAIEEHGRTYHSFKPGKYMLPNDDQEQSRLDLQHQMFTICNDGKLFQAPLEYHRVNRVLDIATGTGIWAIDFADDFPNAEVIGSDLSPIQPRWCPPNCSFEVDDAEDEWVWNRPFSYIHGRALLTCFADPLDVIKKAFDNLEPGGWLEFQDATFPFEYEDPSLPHMVERGKPEGFYTHPFQRWEQLTYEASIVGGRPWDNTVNYKRMFEEAGFVNVVEHKTKSMMNAVNVKTGAPLPQYHRLSEKERKVAHLHGTSMIDGLEGMTNRNFARLGIPPDETRDITKKAKAVLMNNKVGLYNWMYCVYGQRPE